MNKFTDSMIIQTLSDVLPLTLIKAIRSIYEYLKPQGNFLEIGKALSLNYIVFIGGGLIAALFLTEMKLPTELNTVGDFLAGFFSPLAFLWLVIGYFMQNEELSMNREELKTSREALEAQAIELANSVKQQKELVTLSKKEFQYILEKERNNILETTKELSPTIEFLEVKPRKKGESYSVPTFGSYNGTRETITLEKNQLIIDIKNKGKEANNSFFSIEEMSLKTEEKTISDSKPKHSYVFKSDKEFNDEFSIDFIYTNKNNKTISNTYTFTKQENTYRVTVIELHKIID